MKGDKEKRYIVLASDYMRYGRFEVQSVLGPFTKEEAEEAVRSIVFKNSEHEFAEAFPLGACDYSGHLPSEAYEAAFPPHLEAADDVVDEESVAS